ncbi:glutamine synthetase beta-grasp domain-containing protein, partial [Dokdonella sp.]
MSAANVLKLIKDRNITYVDFRFTDLCGVQQHITFPAASINESTFEDGKMFDGSSISGWKGINESDMV